MIFQYPAKTEPVLPIPNPPAPEASGWLPVLAQQNKRKRLSAAILAGAVFFQPIPIANPAPPQAASWEFHQAQQNPRPRLPVSVIASGLTFQPVPIPNPPTLESDIESEEWITLAGLNLDDGRREWAMFGVTTPTGFWEARILSIGPISKSVPMNCGLYSQGNVTVVFDNADGEMSRIRAAGAWRNRSFELFFGRAELGISTFQRVYVGVIANWVLQNDTCSITFTDPWADRFNVPVTKSLRTLSQATGYPDATPNYSQNELIPRVFGRVFPTTGNQSSRNADQLPAYLINPDTNTYVLGRDHVSSWVLYRYGEPMANLSGVTYGTLVAGDGKSYSTVTFPDSQIDLTKPLDGKEITWVGDAFNPVTGQLELNPFNQIEQFLTVDAGIQPAELDTATLDACKAAATARGIKTGWAIVKASLTNADVIERWCQSVGAMIYPTPFGRLAFAWVGMDASPTFSFDGRDIEAGSFVQRSLPSEQLASRLQYNYNYNYLKDYYASQPDLNSPAEEDALGQEIRRNINMPYMRSGLLVSVDWIPDPSSAIFIATKLFDLMRESVILVDWQVPARHFESVVLGGKGLLTHWEGVGAAGFVDAVVTVLGVQLATSPTKSMLSISGYVQPLAATDPDIVDASVTFRYGAATLSVVENDTVSRTVTFRYGAATLSVTEVT